MSAPTPDQLEVTILGPGYGEASVVHVGGASWVIIDSCIDSDTGMPAALAYLRENGVDPAHDVKLIIATHWHDDHIRGLTRVVSECPSAKFCCSPALCTEEFLANVIPFDERHMITAGSGVSELIGVLEQLQQTAGTKTTVRAFANRRVLNLAAGVMPHGLSCEVWTLSPSDAQYRKFLEEIGKLVPLIGQTKHRAPDQGPNHLSVVTWISVGSISMLFGGDLEETLDPETGWSVIVASKERPPGQATVFKIPHHGSQNGHNDGVWETMLTNTPFAVLTPYNRGTKLPTKADIARILGRTKAAYTTAKGLPQRTRRPVAVEKEIRLSTKRLDILQQRTGAVRLRNGGTRDPHGWTIELFRDACLLENF